MAAWCQDELRKVAKVDDLHISPFREDGVTYGTPTWIWSVTVGEDLYVRAYYGQSSRWYRAAIREKAGRITSAGMTKEVAFEPATGRSTISSTRPTAQSPTAARISARCSAHARARP
jgi:hypothetical protein